MSDKIDLKIEYDISNGVVEKAYLVLNGVMHACGVKVTFSNFRSPIVDGTFMLEDAEK